MEKRGKPNWDWTPVECQLKTTQSSRKSIIWQLSPSIVLTNPTVNYCDPSVKLYIDTEKSLQYSSELGWNWHKSWNLPNISIRLQIKDQISNDQLLSPKNLYAQIFAVKKSPENSQRFDKTTLIDVGIRGDSKLEMVDGQVYFSAMKFSSTTYNNEGVNFNLLIVLYINEMENEKPKVLTAVLSPPIFVDSRRSARDYQEKKFNSFIEPFTLDQLDKQFIKRENKSKTQCEIVIKNDSQGLYNYLTAPNIRHKVKHPVFLAVKFSSCIKILYNPKLAAAESLNEILETLQRKLLKDSRSKNSKNESANSDNCNDKTFLFLSDSVSDSLKKKKVTESIEAMGNNSIGLVYDRKEIPAHFQDISLKGNMTKAYREVYSSLLNICKNFEPSQSGSEGYESEVQEYSSVSTKKIKVDDQSSNNPMRVKVTRSAGATEGTGGVQKIKSKNIGAKQQQDQKEQKAYNSFNVNITKKSAFNNLHTDSMRVQNNQNSQPQSEQLPISFQSMSQFSNPQAMSSGSQGGQNKSLEDMLCNNMMLNNWLSNVKNSNVNLYENMGGNPIVDQTMTQSIDGQQRPSPQQSQQSTNFQDPQNIMALLQQINLYKQILAQVSYQNQLLGRNMGGSNPSRSGLGNNLNSHQASQQKLNMSQTLKSQLNQYQNQLQMQNQLNSIFNGQMGRSSNNLMGQMGQMGNMNLNGFMGNNPPSMNSMMGQMNNGLLGNLGMMGGQLGGNLGNLTGNMGSTGSLQNQTGNMMTGMSNPYQLQSQLQQLQMLSQLQNLQSVFKSNEQQLPKQQNQDQ